MTQIKIAAVLHDLHIDPDPEPHAWATLTDTTDRDRWTAVIAANTPDDDELEACPWCDEPVTDDDGTTDCARDGHRYHTDCHADRCAHPDCQDN